MSDVCYYHRLVTDRAIPEEKSLPITKYVKAQSAILKRKATAGNVNDDECYDDYDLETESKVFKKSNFTWSDVELNQLAYVTQQVGDKKILLQHAFPLSSAGKDHIYEKLKYLQQKATYINSLEADNADFDYSKSEVMLMDGRFEFLLSSRFALLNGYMSEAVGKNRRETFPNFSFDKFYEIYGDKTYGVNQFLVMNKAAKPCNVLNFAKAYDTEPLPIDQKTPAKKLKGAIKSVPVQKPTPKNKSTSTKRKAASDDADSNDDESD